MPGKQWDDEEDSSSGSESSGSAPPPPPTALRGTKKFEDEEEDNDSDVLESWDAEDSEAEAEKAKKAAEAKAKAKAAAEAAAAKKVPKGARVASHVADRARQEAAAAAAQAALAAETESERRERMRRSEQESDLQHAADLFGGAGLSAGGPGANAVPRKSAAVLKASAVPLDAKDPSKTVDLSALPLLNPLTKDDFDALLQTLAPLLAANAKKAHYSLFVVNLVRELCKDLPSDQIKQVTSATTLLTNNKLREEKNADKTNKKSKAAKTKTTLAMGRANVVDTGTYDDDAYGDDDFM